MKAMILPLALLLTACTAPQAPAGPPATPASPEAAAPVAKRAAGSASTDPLLIFRAFGTEPFWNINVVGTTLTWTTPDNQAGVVMQGERKVVATGAEISGQHEGKAFVVTVTPGSCSDGMSDNQYTLVSTFRYGDTEYKGCGEAAK